MYCFHCGTQIEDSATVCPACNKAQPIAQYPTSTSFVYIKPKIPGRGLGIAGMVLGIIGSVYCLPMLSSSATISTALGQHLDLIEKIAAIIAYLIYAIPSILALTLASVGRKKGYRTGVSMAGVVMGIIGISATVLSSIIILFA